MFVENIDPTLAVARASTKIVMSLVTIAVLDEHKTAYYGDVRC